MSWFGSYIKSSIGAKHVMAISGLGLVGFVLVHMAGNLQVFLGQDALNAYAQSLQDLGPLLWVARIGLIVLFLVHIVSAIRLVQMNKAARPVGYQKISHERSTFASRVMPMSGLIVLAFLVYHLVHFTFGVGPFAEIHALEDGMGRADVYNMVVLSFQNPGIAAVYIGAMILLCLHLSHGVSSIFKSLGLYHTKYNGIVRMAGPLVATLVLIGNCSMPIAVLAKIVTAK